MIIGVRLPLQREARRRPSDKKEADDNTSKKKRKLRSSHYVINPSDSEYLY
jgi:hypothetical protein